MHSRPSGATHRSAPYIHQCDDFVDTLYCADALACQMRATGDSTIRATKTSHLNLEVWSRLDLSPSTSVALSSTDLAEKMQV